MNDKRCFLCGRNDPSDPLERHHILGGTNRKKSEKYGLVVYLCGNRCHRNGRGAVHKNGDQMRRLRRYGQLKAMEEQGWTEEDFRRDIERGDGWLFTADGNPAGYLCISRRSEAAYTAIEGEWLSCAGPYLTIHRIMVSDAYRGKGIASEMISLADDFAHAYCCAGVRIDTAPGNEPRRAMLRKNGLETCGTIRLVGGVDNGALRIALEKLVR